MASTLYGLFNDHVEWFLWLFPRLTDDQCKKATAKARVKKHREKLYGNPELLEEYRRKERERYVSSRKRQQKKWRQKFCKILQKTKDLERCSRSHPSSTIVEPGPSRKVLRPMTENGEILSALEAPSPVVTRTSTPKPNRSAASRPRAKLKEKKTNHCKRKTEK